MKPTDGFDVMAVTIYSFCFPQPNHIDRIVAYLLLSMGGRGSGAASKGPHKRTAMLAVRKPGQKGVTVATASQSVSETYRAARNVLQNRVRDARVPIVSIVIRNGQRDHVA